MRRFAFLLAAALAAPAGAAAQATSAPPPPVRLVPGSGEHLRVYLATYGPGSEVWEKFGHNAIWIQDTRNGRTLSYNWGMFSFDQPGFVPRLLRGSMLYWMEARDAQEEADAYVYYQRSITLQELALTGAQKAELDAFVQWNAREENRFYNYHYFRDNCSTRVRDALDRVLGGTLARELQQVRSDETFRSHSLRLTASAPLTYTGIELGLADSADHALTAWEEAFVPMELMRSVRAVQVSDGQGGMRPLVVGEQEVFRGSFPEREHAPNRVPVYLAIGVLVGALFLVLGRAAHRAAAARWSWAVLGTLWSLAVGVFGTLVLLLWTSTGHAFTYGNENLFQANPLPLLLVVLVPAAALGARWARRPAFILAAFAAALSLLGLLLKPLPGFDQMNHDIIALLLPAHLGLAAALLYRSRDALPSPPVDG